MRELILRFRGNTSGVNKAFDETRKQMGGLATESETTQKKSRGAFSKLAGFLGGFAKKAAIGTTTAAVATLGFALKKGFDRLTSIENAQAKLRGLGNSTKSVQKIMDNALAAVEGTSFGLGEAANVAASAVAAGIKPGAELERVLKAVANSAAAAGVPMEEMGGIFNKVASLGKAQNDVLQQVASRGLPIYETLAKQLGVTTDEVFKMASAGKISFPQFEKAMKSASGTVAAEMGKTFGGAVANLNASLGRIGAGLLGGVFPHLAPAVIKITKALKPFEKLAGQVGDKLGKMLVPAAAAVASWIGKAATSVVKFTKQLDFSSWDAFVGSVKGAGGGALSGLGKTFESLRTNAALLWPPIKELLATMPELGGAAAQGAAAGIKILAEVLSFAVKHMDVIMKILPPMIAAYAAWKVASLATAGAQSKLQAVQLAMTPVTLANNLLRVTAIALERKHAIATGQYTVAQNASRVSVLKSVAVWTAQKAAMLASAVASKAVTAAQWLMNAAMSANPIGIIVVALVALAAGLVLAYKRSETFRNVVQKAMAGVKIAFGWVQTAAVSVFGWVKKNWPLIRNIIIGPIGIAVTTVVKHWGTIRSAFSLAVKWVKGAWKKSWAGITSVVTAPARLAETAIGKITGPNGIRAKLNGLKTWTTGTWKKGWNKVSSVITAPARLGQTAMDKIMGRNGIRAKFSGAQTWVRGTWKKGWNRVQEVLTAPARLGRDGIGRALGKDGVRAKFNAAKDWVRGPWKERWNKIKDVLLHPIRRARDGISSILGKTGIRAMFSNAVTAVAKIWSGLDAKFKKPIRIVVTTVLGGLRAAANTIAKVVGLGDSWIPEFKLPKGFRDGGSTPNVGRNKIAGVVHGNEHVWSAWEVAKAGGHRAMEAARAAARAGKSILPGYMSGGPVQPVPGRGNRHTSGYPWATWAGDFPVGMNTPVRAWKDGVVALVRYLTTSYGRHLRINHDDGSQSLYAHNQSIKVAVGDKVKAGQVVALSGSTGNSTGPHVHFETMGKPFNGGTAMSGGGFGFLDGILDKITGLKDKVTKPLKALGDNGLVQMVGKVGTKLLPAVTDKLKSSASSVMDKATGLISSAASWIKGKFGGYSKDQLDNAAVISDVAHKLGFGKRGAIIGLITSLVETNLRNLGWGDRDSVGLFQQRAPWGPRADRMNPARSASMFFNGGQGGQPGLRSKNWQSMGMGQAAQAVQVSAFPDRYAQRIGEAEKILARLGQGGIGHRQPKALLRDTGGWVPPGASTIINKTGKPEGIFNDAQMRAMLSGNSEPKIVINIDGALDPDAVARQVQRVLVDAGQRRSGVKIGARTR